MTGSAFPRGSEWRKWDLHLHVPRTKLNNGYVLPNGEDPDEEFCRILHESDVYAFGLTDYFSISRFFEIKKRYLELYPDSTKLLLPNIELRLPVAVNKAGQAVNLHLIFNSDLTEAQGKKFLDRLKTSETTGPAHTAVNCSDLTSKDDYNKATVNIDAINDAIVATFGEYAVSPPQRQRHLLVVTSAKGDGIRAGGNGIERKNLIQDEIDKFSDAIFSNNGSRDFYLGTSRYETDELSLPKPVFDGSDAHSFADLRTNLGRHVDDEGRKRSITWIKADPTYDGLLQTLIEPGDRVAIQPTEPDAKEPYRVVHEVRFSGTSDFPEKIELNKNLNSIIGSRSSGKSALLAHMAHAVDPQGTVRTQMAASRLAKEQDAGPAAGHSWDSVSSVKCEVVWASGSDTEGRLIYIPQNALYTLSEQPDEIMNKISPAIFRTYPDVKMGFDKMSLDVDGANVAIDRQVKEWFESESQASKMRRGISDLGDKSAIERRKSQLSEQIAEIKARVNVSDDEASMLESLSERIDKYQTKIAAVADDIKTLSPFVVGTGSSTDHSPSIRPGAVGVSISIRPDMGLLPTSLSSEIGQIRDVAVRELQETIEGKLVETIDRLESDHSREVEKLQELRADNAALLAKQEGDEELSKTTAELSIQVGALAEIAKQEATLDKVLERRDYLALSISKEISKRSTAVSEFVNLFESQRRILGDLVFHLESGVDSDEVAHASDGFNQRTRSEYIPARGEVVDFSAAQRDPAKFFESLLSGAVPINKGYLPVEIASAVLRVAERARFGADLDGDRIGGFSRSSMTPGKQALFALTLILNESQEPWPLLIDQPEDDLDSRSIYDTIVPYLSERKRERQIIMVTHNANLVVGADSEQVIVANRHGADRPNIDGRTFSYYSGSLEYSLPVDQDCPTALERCGIREHACTILDGGEEAFQKRRDKYKI